MSSNHSKTDARQIGKEKRATMIQLHRKASCELARIFEGDDSFDAYPNSDPSVDNKEEKRILELLTRHPDLAKVAFWDGTRMKNERPPLSYLVERNAEFDTLRRVYKLHPKAIRHEDKFGNTPLHFACKTRANTQTVAFLLKEYPAAAYQPNRSKSTPLHLLFSYGSGRELTRELIATILPHTRDSINKTNHKGVTPLHLSLGTDVAVEVLEYLFSFAASQQTVTSFNVHAGTFGSCVRLLEIQHAQALAKIMPNLTTFSCCADCLNPTEWTNEAFTFLVGEMRESKCLQDLTLGISRRLLASNPLARAALERLVACTSSLKSLSIEFEEKEDDDDNMGGVFYDDESLEGLVQGFTAADRSIESVSLNGMNLLSATPLQKLLSGPWQPKSLDLSGTTVSRPWVDGIDYSACRCENLNLNLCKGEWTLGILNQIRTMPTISSLVFSYSGTSDVTDRLALLLEQCHTLSDLHVSIEPGICDHKQILTTLETQNRTLKKYSYCDESLHPETAAKIRYYTDLNRYGRAKLSTLTSTKVDLVAGLVSAAKDADAKRVSEDAAVSIYFGLLSMIPGTWTG